MERKVNCRVNTYIVCAVDPSWRFSYLGTFFSDALFQKMKIGINWLLSTGTRGNLSPWTAQGTRLSSAGESLLKSTAGESWLKVDRGSRSRAGGSNPRKWSSQDSSRLSKVYRCESQNMEIESKQGFNRPTKFKSGCKIYFMVKMTIQIVYPLTPPPHHLNLSSNRDFLVNFPALENTFRQWLC